MSNANQSLSILLFIYRAAKDEVTQKLNCIDLKHSEPQ